MSKVYVLQATRHQADVGPAAVYGDILFVLSPGDRTCANPELSLEKLRRGLQHFRPAEDFIVWAGGDPLSAIITGAVMLEMGVTKFRFLRFEKNRHTRPGEPVSGFYSPVEINLEKEQD